MACLGVLHEPAHVPPPHVRLNGAEPAAVLPVHHPGVLRLLQRGQLVQGDPAPIGEGNEEVVDLLDVGPVLGLEPDEDVEPASPLIDLAHDDPADRRFHRSLNLSTSMPWRAMAARSRWMTRLFWPVNFSVWTSTAPSTPMRDLLHLGGEFLRVSALSPKIRTASWARAPVMSSSRLWAMGWERFRVMPGMSSSSWLISSWISSRLQPPPGRSPLVQLNQDVEVVHEVPVAPSLTPPDAGEDSLHARHLHEPLFDLVPLGDGPLEAHVGVHGDLELECPLLQGGHVLPAHEGKEDQAQDQDTLPSPGRPVAAGPCTTRKSLR